MNRADRRRQEKRRTLSDGPPRLRALLEEAMACHRAGQLARAESLYRQALALQPDHPEVLHLLGLVAYQSGALETAVTLLTAAIAHDAKPSYLFNLGVVLQKQGKLEEAVATYSRAVTLNPAHGDAYRNLGNTFTELGSLSEAITAYRRALAINPGSPDYHNNLGVALKDTGAIDEAIALYRQALRLDSSHPEAHSNLGSALMEQGHLEEAVDSFHRALRIKPAYLKAHYHLGFARIRQGRFGDAVQELRHCAASKHDHGQPVQVSAVYASRLKHDAEQIQYLLDRELIPAHYTGYLNALKRLQERAVHEAGQGRCLRLSREEMSEVAPSFNRILHYADCPELPAGAVNPDLDVAAIEARYHATRPEIMYIDQLLTQEALDSLRRFCLRSTIWKRDYENGYLGAFLGDGFSPPPLLQIAEELRSRFRAIFGSHPLVQAWAFKYDSERRGLNIHADAAAVNVNFWITPDVANLNPGRGGLTVWDKEAPQDWNFREYNNSRNESKVRAFLHQSGAQAVVIPYGENRAAVFNSDLFHETDQFRFRDDYESRRINITLLYGKRLG